MPIPTKGRPYPKNTRTHREIGGGLAAGTLLVADPVTEDIAIAGDSSTRLYFKSSAPGTLSFEFYRPNQVDLYDTNAADDETVVADTEVIIDIAVEGEAKLKVTFDPTGAGAITYADVCHNPGW